MAHEQHARMRRILGVDLVRAAQREVWQMPGSPEPPPQKTAYPDVLRQPDVPAGNKR